MQTEIRCDGLACAHSGRRTDRSIGVVDDLIVVGILPRELRRIGDALLDDIAARITRDVLTRIFCGRGVLPLVAARHPSGEVDDGIALFHISVAVRMRRKPVVDLRDLLCHGLERGRGNRPRRRRMRGICIVDLFEIARRS